MIGSMNIILGGTHGLGWELATELRERGEETFVVGSSYRAEEHGDGMLVNLAQKSEAERLAGFISELGETTLQDFYWVAGKGYNGDFAEQPDVADMMYVNLTHPMIVAQAAWKKIVSQDVAANMVVVSSTTGVKIRDNETTYATTKGAQVSFARNLGKEAERLITTGELHSAVKVTLFEPGGMKTPFWGKEGDRPAAYDEKFMDPPDVAAFMLEFLQGQETIFAEKMIEKPELDTWLAERR
ncbi:SDR family oxidoreductase [Candidatus Saccharibacteria bacterium]|nr:MAG: SDR family oxidoreductase [Candidatus Saccharibacteria bacterium]